MLDVVKIRAEFPILKTTMNGQPLVYLDHAASTQKPMCVIQAVTNVWQNHYANIHRGLYDFSQKTTQAYENARKTVAHLINAQEDEIIFTRSATESINLVAATWARTNLKKGDAIAITPLEHHANIVPWQMLRDELGLTLQIIPATAAGEITPQAVQKTLTSATKLVAIPHVVNSTGSLLPVQKIIQLAQQNGAKVLVDGCQAIARLPVNVAKLGADFYVFSGHKMYAPSGTGVLFAKAEILNTMPPYQGGGDMIETVTLEKTTFAPAPAKFEAGTPNIEGGIGMGAAAQFLQNWGMENIAQHEAEIMAYAKERLQQVENLKIVGNPQVGCISFTMQNAHSSDVAMVLNNCGIAVRTGHHCAQTALAHFGLSSTIRASFGITTLKAEVDALIKGLTKVNKLL